MLYFVVVSFTSKNFVLSVYEILVAKFARAKKGILF